MNVVIPSVHDPLAQFSSGRNIHTPPLPVRSRMSRNASSTNGGQEQFQTLVSTNFRRESLGLTTLADHQLSSLMLPCVTSSQGPPIPPRVPLKRSLSLTNRPPPPRASKSPSSTADKSRTTVNAAAPFATEHVPVIIDPLRVRTPSSNLARSAPTLNNINNSNHFLFVSSQGQIKFVPLTRNNHERNETGAHIVPLARWPLSDAQPRSNELSIDGLAGKFPASSNEYVDSPGASNRLRLYRNKTLSLSNSNSHLQNDVSHLTGLPQRACIASIVVSHEKRSFSVLQKLRKFVSGRSRSGSGPSSENNSITTPLTVQSSISSKSPECKNTLICRRCGKCRCRDCLRRTSRKYLNLPTKDAVVDCLSCMCLVKPVFYHCLKDSNGEDDCSEKPCACCSQPNCMSRWSIMTFLLPCLPCLCLYLPLKYALSCCCYDDTGCSCENSTPASSAFKTLLESENSSI